MAKIAKNSSPPLLRLAHPMAFMDFLRRVGTPVERHLQRQGLPALCEDPNTFVHLVRVWNFFDSVAREEGPMLGWLTGVHAGDQKLNAGLLRKLDTVPTLLEALRSFQRLIRTEASALHVDICERQDNILFCLHYPGMKENPGHSISQAYQIEVVIDLIRHFLGPNWCPEEIGVESAIFPSLAQEHFPGSRILTQQEAGYIVVPRCCLHHAAPRTRTAPRPGGEYDPFSTENLDYTDTLRTLLKPYLPEGYPTEAFAAKLMDTSVRTLTRRLNMQHLTYGKLIDELRFEVARDLLQDQGAKIACVAEYVGFRDQANFTRMFSRIAGVSPVQFRNRCR